MPARPRSYRAVQASGEGDIDRMLDLVANGHQCPHCGAMIQGLHEQRSQPRQMPERSDEQRLLRALELEPAAARLADRLRELVTDSTYEMWLAPLRLLDVVDGTLYLGAPPEIAGWVADRFGRLLDTAASELAGRPIHAVVFASPPLDAATLRTARHTT